MTWIIRELSKPSLTVFLVQGLNLVMQVCGKIFVILDTFPAWNSDLDHTDLSDKLGVCVQEPLHSRDFLQNSFRVVQPVDANDQCADVISPSHISHLFPHGLAFHVTEGIWARLFLLDRLPD